MKVVELSSLIDSLPSSFPHRSKIFKSYTQHYIEIPSASQLKDHPWNETFSRGVRKVRTYSMHPCLHASQQIFRDVRADVHASRALKATATSVPFTRMAATLLDQRVLDIGRGALDHPEDSHDICRVMETSLSALDSKSSLGIGVLPG